MGINQDTSCQSNISSNCIWHTSLVPHHNRSRKDRIYDKIHYVNRKLMDIILSNCFHGKYNKESSHYMKDNLICHYLSKSYMDSYTDFVLVFPSQAYQLSSLLLFSLKLKKNQYLMQIKNLLNLQLLYW